MVSTSHPETNLIKNVTKGGEGVSISNPRGVFIVMKGIPQMHSYLGM